MRIALSAPYADVRAADLVLTLDAPAVAPLEALDARLGAFVLELGVLGHSHQVRVRAPGLELTETVACRPGADGDLPPAHQQRRGARRYGFTAAVQPLSAASARTLAARVESDAHGIVGVFAGDASAFTALRACAVPGGVRWETWHAYPQTAELVRTTGTVLDA